MKPTEILMEEHRGIERMIDVVESAANRLERGETVPGTLFVEAGEFFAGFADRCHHAKEERLLFPALEKRGVRNHGGPIGVMLAEHVQGRAYVRAIREQGAQYAEGKLPGPRSLIEGVQGYAGLLRPHIRKEDSALFPLADRVLSDADQKDLLEAFERVEREELGEGTHERYHSMIERLEKAVTGV